jgi:hypothetical protein
MVTDKADLLAQFSNALATRAEAAKNAVVAIFNAQSLPRIKRQASVISAIIKR